jgi:hypothetical protein
MSGNAKIFELNNRDYVCIGSYEDTSKDRIYYFVYGTQDDHHILEYDLQSDTVSTVFRDSGNAETNLFRWKERFLITEINKVEDVLYFTSDRYGEPQEINVEKSKKSMAQLDTDGFTVESSQILNENPDKYYPYFLYVPAGVVSPDNNYPGLSVSELKRQYISVKKKPPYRKPTFTFDTNSDIKKNNLYGKSFQFRYRYHMYDKQVTEWSAISDASHSSVMDFNVSDLNSGNQNQDNVIKISLANGNHQVEFIEVCARTCKDFDVDKQGNRGDFYIIGKIKNDYEKHLNSEENIFEFSNDKIYPFADKNEIAKLYDNVPKKARTQTLLGDNRIAYGNYLEGFDIDSIDVTLTPKYGQTSISNNKTNLIFPAWTVAENGRTSVEVSNLSASSVIFNNSTNSPLAGGSSGSDIESQKGSAYSGADAFGSAHTVSLKNSSVSTLEGLSQGQSFTWNLSSLPFRETSTGNGPTGFNDPGGGSMTPQDGIVIGPINSSFKAKDKFGPRQAQNVDGVIPSNNYNSILSAGADLESFHVNRLIDFNGSPTSSFPAFCGHATGGANGYPVICFAFDYSVIEPSPNLIVDFNIQANFAVRKSRPGNPLGAVLSSKSKDLAEDTSVQNISIQKTINTSSSGQQYSNDSSGLNEQMKFVAEQMGVLFQQYSSSSSKPEGSLGWLIGPYVDYDKKVIILPVIAKNKNSFSSTFTQPRHYRIISSQEWLHPDASDASSSKLAGVSLNFNMPENNSDPLLSAASQSNVCTMNTVGIAGASEDGNGSFKSGAFHDFGLIYYDEYGRNSTVAIDNENGSSKCYVKFYSERQNGLDEPILAGQDNIFGKARIDWEISHQPPVWAKYYSWAYSKNTSVDEFIQFICPEARVLEDTEDGEARVFLSLSSLKGNGYSYREQKNPLIDYKYVEGDRIRFITSPYNYGENTPYLGTYVDLKITDYKFVNTSDDFFDQASIEGTEENINSQFAETNADLGLDEGYYITLDSPSFTQSASFEFVRDAGNTTSNFYAGGLFEIYRPLKETEDESNRVYYEFGFKHTIANPHTRERAHRGMTQTQQFDSNGDMTEKAKGFFNQGDVFFKQRIMRDNVSSGTGEAFVSRFVEDYHLNDFYPTNHINIGRPNLFVPLAKEELKKSSVTYSEPFQPDVNYNGLSSFELFSFEDFNRDDGSIQKIHSRDTDLVVIQEDRTYKASINKDIITNADGTSNVGLSSKVIGIPISLGPFFGISKNPESFAYNGNTLYWVDVKKGAVLRLKGDTLQPISRLNMVQYFYDKSESYRESDPMFGFTDNVAYWYQEGLIEFATTKASKHSQNESFGIDLKVSEKVIEQFNTKHYAFRILGAYNPKHDEYVITFPEIPGNNANALDQNTNTWSSLNSAPEAIAYNYATSVEPETLVWSERNERWVSFASYVPEMYGKINKRFFSFVKGELFLHDSNTNHNTFYDVTYHSKLKFPFNGVTSKVKTYHSLTIDGTFALESSSSGTEESTKTGYDVVIDTNLSSTTIDREVFDRKEGLLYAQIPFASGNIDGEPGGSEYFGLGNITTSSSSTTVNLLIGSSNPGIAVGDVVYYDNSGTNTSLGTISAIGTNTLTLTSNATATITNTFGYVIKSSIVEGDRVKGNFMNVEVSKRTKKPIEIYGINTSISKSELSDE